MSLQFGIGSMYTGPSNDETEFGCLQGITFDFSYDKATMYCGSELYPSDIRIHTSTITGRATFAEIDAAAFYTMLGGNGYTDGDTDLTILSTTSPASFRMRCVTTTDSITMTVMFHECRSDSLSFSLERTSYVIPDFGFTAFSDSSGNVANIVLGDAS